MSEGVVIEALEALPPELGYSRLAVGVQPSGAEVLEPNFGMDRGEARRLLYRLDESELDILAMIMLGIKDKEIAARTPYESAGKLDTIKLKIYKKLKVDEHSASDIRPEARRVAWAGGLLEEVWSAELEGTDEFPWSRKAITDSDLNDDDITTMDQYGLSITHIRVAKLLTHHLTRKEIASRLGHSEASIKKYKKEIKDHVISSDGILDPLDLLSFFGVRGTLPDLIDESWKRTPDHERDTAKKLLAKLSKKQKDILGLAMCGLSPKEIVSRTRGMDERDLNEFMSEIYDTLEIEIKDGQNGHGRSIAVREIAWAGGLLEDATDPESHVTYCKRTKKVLKELNLGQLDVEIMGSFRLTVTELQLLKLRARELTMVQISELTGEEYGTLWWRAQRISRKLGLETAKQLTRAINVHVGKMALSTQVEVPEAA